MSQLKDTFKQARNAFRKQALDLFPTNSCTIDDEDQFFEHVKKTMVDFIFIEDVNGEFKEIRYVVFQLHKCLEKQLTSLKELATNPSPQQEHILKIENNIIAIVTILNRIIDEMNDIGGFTFPYFDQILELTHNPLVLRSLVLLSIRMISKKRDTSESLVPICSIFCFTTPFLRLLYHFNWDQGLLKNKLADVTQSRKSTETVPDLIKEVFLAILDNGKDIINIIEEKSLLREKDCRHFVKVLSEKLLEHKKITKKGNSDTYFKALGEVDLAFSLLHADLNGNFIAEVNLIQSLQGFLIYTIKEEEDVDIPAHLATLVMEPCHLKFKYCIHPSTVNIILEKVRELGKKQGLPLESKTQEVEEVHLLFLGIEINRQLCSKVKKNVELSQNEVHEFIRKLFCIDIESYEKGNKSKPPILEMWGILIRLYKSCYSSYRDESYNVFGDLSNSPKDKVNTMMYHFIGSIFFCIKEMVESIDDEEQETINVFMEEYYNTLNEILSDMVTAVTVYDLQSNYLSLIVYQAISEVFQTICDTKAFDYFEIPLVIIQKVEAVIQLTFTPNFDELFKNASDAHFLQKIVSIQLDFIFDVLFCGDDETIEAKTRRNYMTHMSTFSMIDYISERKVNCTNEFAKKTQEEIIRFYIMFHLNSQKFAISDEEEDQIYYYSFERLNQVWKAMMNYCETYPYFIIETCDTEKIIALVLDSNQQFPRYYKVFDLEVLSLYYSRGFFDLDSDYYLADSDVDETLFPILLSFKSHNTPGFQSLLEVICVAIQKNFEILAQDAERLESLYQRDDPEFTKAFLLTEFKVNDFTRRLTHFTQMMTKRGETKASAEDTLQVSSRLQDVLEEYLPRFMSSPVFFMSHREYTNLVFGPLARNIAQRVYPRYVANLPNILKTVNQELQKESGTSRVLEEKVMFLSWKQMGSIEQFFCDTYCDDPKEVYKINSVLFLPTIFNRNGMYLLGFNDTEDNPYFVKATPLIEVLPQITIEIVTIASIICKQGLYNQKYANFKGFLLVNEKQMTNYGNICPSVAEYFKTKVKILTELMTTNDETKNEEDNFWIRFGALICLRETLYELTIEQVIHLYGSLEAIHITLKCCCETFLRLFQVVARYFKNTDTPFISELEIEARENSDFFKNNNMLRNFYKIVDYAVSVQFLEIGKIVQRLALNCEKIQIEATFKGKGKEPFFVKVHDILAEFLDQIDHRLIAMKHLNTKEFNYDPLSVMMINIRNCYAYFFASIYNFEGSAPTIFGFGGGLFANPETLNNSNQQEGLNLNNEDNMWIQKLQEQCKPMFLKFLAKLTVFLHSQAVQSQPALSAFYKDSLNEFYRNYTNFLYENRENCSAEYVEQQEKMFQVKIYKNPFINRLRNVAPVLFFLNRIITEKTMDKSEEETLDGFLSVLWQAIIDSLAKITVEELKQENFEFIENDFLELLRDINHAAMVLAYGLTTKAVNEDIGIEVIEASAKILLTCLQKAAELSDFFKSFKTKFKMLLQDKNMMYVLYSVLHSKGFDMIASDPKLIDMLLRNTEKQFYILAEVYALNAYDPEKILTLKLKSSVHLDKTGSRIFQGRSIKNIEPYFNDLLIKIWQENFTIQKDNNSENPHSDRVVVVKEKQDMKGKVGVCVEGQNVNVSALTFLKYGMDISARKVMERLMENIASTTREHMKEMMAKRDDQEVHEYVLSEISQSAESLLGVLAGLVRNYPELSYIVTSYELEEYLESPHDFSDLFPQFERKQSFLGFFIKHCCCLYSLKASITLEDLLYKNSAPILVEYEGRPLVLSSYNRVMVFREIVKAFEDTLTPPEKLLKTIYTKTTWCMLGQIAASLADVIGEGSHEEFLLEAITSIISVCMKALRVYFDHRSEERTNSNDLDPLYSLLTRLAENEMIVKTKLFIIPNEGKTSRVLKSEDDLPWACQIYKEETYKNRCLSFSGQVIPQHLPTVLTASHDEKVMQSYCYKSKGLDKAVSLNLLKFLNYPILFFGGLKETERDWITNPHEEIEELKIIIKSLDPNVNPYKQDPEYVRVAKLVYKLLTTFVKFPKQFLAHSNKEDLKPAMYYGYNSANVVKLDSRFRKLVKKSLGWHFVKKVQTQNIQDIFSKNQEDFSMLIKKIGLKEISKLIQANKKRIKTLVRDQQEKFLVSKLGAMMNHQVNIEHMLSLQTDVDNLKFYNEQNEFDKKLILLLASRDFIEGLGEEIKGQSETIRKVLADEEAKKKKIEEGSLDDVGVQQNQEVEVKLKKEPILESKKAKENVKKEETEQEEEDGDGSDVEEVSDFSDEEEEEEENKKDEGDNDDDDDDDGDYEDVSDFSDEEKDGEEEDVKNVKAKGKAANEKGKEVKEKKEKKEKNAQPKAEEVLPVENVSSACHTRDVSDNEEEDEDKEGEEDISEEEIDPENPDLKATYHMLLLTSQESFEFNELIGYNLLINNWQKAEKKLASSNISSFSLRKIVPASKALCEEWVNQVLFLCFKMGKRLNKSFKVLNNFNLVSEYLYKAFLDPLKEEAILPLLALYLAGYRFRAVKIDPEEDAGEEDILLLLREYAIRSPSVFFVPFNIHEYDDFIEKDSSKEEWANSGKWTICELLLLLYIQREFGKKNETKEHRTLGQFVCFLLHLRFKAKEDFLTKYVKDLTKENVISFNQTPIHCLTELVRNNPNLLLHNSNSTLSENFSFIFKCLAFVPTYRKGILTVCHKLLFNHIESEKNILANVGKNILRILEIPDKLPLEEKNYLLTALVGLQLYTPAIFSVFTEHLNKINVDDSELASFLLESEAFTLGLKDLASCYMETLDLISRSNEKKYLKGATKIRRKLQLMLEVPVQYHIFISKLKELSQNKSLLNVSEKPSLPGLVKISSDQGVNKNKDISTFQNTLISWINKNRDFINNVVKYDTEQEALNLWLVKKFSWVLDFNVKEKILREALSARDEEEKKELLDEDCQITIYIRRKYILEDTLKEFEDKKSEGVLHNFKVEFVKEPGIDEGGLKKEWLTLLSKEIFDPRRGLFKLSPNTRTLHPNPLSIIQPDNLIYFRLAGTIAGLAIKEEIPIYANFSKSFLKLVAGNPINLSDLEDIEPELVQSLTWMMNNSVKELEQPFIYELDVFGRKLVQELVENGSNVILDDNNKELFISKMHTAKALKEVEKQVNSFKQGFYEIIPEEILRIFSSGELEILISGKPEIDVKDLKKHTIYKDLGKDHPLIVWFWEIVENMDESMLANMLFFITGSSQVPHGGFKNSPIMLVKGSEDTSNLPVAHTCFSELEIPLYETKEQFYEKLVLAICEGKEGFYIV